MIKHEDMMTLLKACGASLEVTARSPYPHIDWKQRELVTHEITKHIDPETHEYFKEEKRYPIPTWLRKQDIEGVNMRQDLEDIRKLVENTHNIVSAQENNGVTEFVSEVKEQLMRYERDDEYDMADAFAVVDILVRRWTHYFGELPRLEFEWGD